MLADLDLALKRPSELIARLHAEHGSLDGFEQLVSDRFAALLQDSSARAQIPRLDGACDPARLPPAGTLVKLRGMVQDPGLGGELYPAMNADGTKLLMYGMEDGASDVSAEDYSKLRERQLYYVVNVPGETAWAKEKLDGPTESALPAEMQKLSVEEGVKASTSQLASKFPLPSEPSFGLVAKLYGETEESLKTTDVREFVGVIGTTTWSTGIDDLHSSEADDSAMTVPALHVLFKTPAEQISTPNLPGSPEAKEALRAELVEHLAAGLGGDRDAAEWVLLALLARIHTRHATGMALGSLSLNLAFAQATETDIAERIACLVPSSASLDLSIETLNDSKTRMAPKSRDETLDAGRLQLANGTAVVVDLRKIGEGKLEDTGVRNLRSLATAVTQQKLSYEFPYSSFDLDTDLNFVLVSEGKAILPTDCVVYVRPAAHGASEEAKQPDESKLDQFRGYISAMKHASFSIPTEMSDVIQSDYVERRQASQGGEAMTQDDLLFRMTAARLLALSYGETALSKEAWERTAELDDRRKERMPVVPQAQQAQHIL